MVGEEKRLSLSSMSLGLKALAVLVPLIMSVASYSIIAGSFKEKITRNEKDIAFLKKQANDTNEKYIEMHFYIMHTATDVCEIRAILANESTSPCKDIIYKD